MIEGPRLLAEALDANVVVHAVYVDERATCVLPVGVPIPWGVRAGVLDDVGDATTSQGVLAVAEIPEIGLESLDSRRTGVREANPTEPCLPPLILVLVELADPGNVGTLLRAADAAGACAIVVGGVDVFGPKVVRSSAGAVFRVPLAEVRAVQPAFDWLSDQGVVPWATTVRGGVAAHLADLSGPTALVLGNESHGLDSAVEALAGGRVTIPMPGNAESLNVAMAGTVLLYEALRQRRQ